MLFLTGTDEHGQKVARAAEANGMDPQTWTDQIVERWKAAWAELDIAYDDFIRTTEERHVRAVQHLWQGATTRATSTWTATRACTAWPASSSASPRSWSTATARSTAGRSRRSGRRTTSSASPSTPTGCWEYHCEHPEFVRPETRRREVVSFVEQGLQDLSISRPASPGGADPLGPKHVMYVWVDALQNYSTAAGWDADMERFRHVWPADYHFVGKDILQFHAVTWPAILLAAGLPLPRTVQAYGWLLVGGEKMSKTKLTGIAPHDLVEPFGSDAVRYFFQREVAFGQDGNFSWEALVERYNADLANGLGNLASRVTAMVGRYRDGVLHRAGHRRRGRGPGGRRAGLRRGRGRPGRGRLRAGPCRHLAVRRRRQRLPPSASPGTWPRPARTWPWTPSYTGAEALRIAALLTAPWLTRTASALWAALGAKGDLAAARLPATWPGPGCPGGPGWSGSGPCSPASTPRATWPGGPGDRGPPRAPAGRGRRRPTRTGRAATPRSATASRPPSATRPWPSSTSAERPCLACRPSR